MKRKFLLTLVIVLILLSTMLGLFSCNSKDSYEGGSSVKNEVNSSLSTSSTYSGSALTSRKIIYTAYVSLYSDNAKDSVEKVKTMLNSDEWVESEEISSSYAKIIVRVKSTRLNEFLNSIKQAGDVGNYTISSEDITLEYSDLEQDLTQKKAERDALQALMATATTTADVISLNDKIYELNAEIAKLETRKNTYDSKIDYSTITIYVNQNYYEQEESFGAMTKNALTNSWVALGSFFKYLLLAIIYVFPFALVIAIICVIIYFVKKKKGLKFFERAKKKNKVEEKSLIQDNENVKNQEKQE